MHFTIPIIEPLLITSLSGEWVHPNIEVMTIGFDDSENGNLYGPLMKLDITFKSGKSFQTILLTNEDCMNDMMEENELQNYIEMLFVTLGEDVWCPGNLKPFVFTKYGEKFNEDYQLFSEEYKVSVSPDVSLNHDAVDWWWDT